MACVAHRTGVPLIVDNMVAMPYMNHSIEWGADSVVHSATTYSGGNGAAATAAPSVG